MEQSSIKWSNHQSNGAIINRIKRASNDLSDQNGIERFSIAWNNHKSNGAMINRMEQLTIESNNHQWNRTTINQIERSSLYLLPESKELPYFNRIFIHGGNKKERFHKI